MAEDHSEHNTMKNIFIDFWKNKQSESLSTERLDVRELLTKCLEEVTASYMISDVDPMLKSTMEEMSKTALKLVQDVPPGGKLTVSDATLDTAFRAGVDERAEENHVVPDTARWLLSFTNVVLYPFISSIMKSTLFVPYDEYSDWQSQYIDCFDKIIDTYMDLYDEGGEVHSEIVQITRLNNVYKALLELFELVDFPIQSERRSPDTTSAEPNNNDIL